MNEETKEKKPLTLTDRLASPEFAAELAKALPSHISPEHFERIARNALLNNPAIAKCDQRSIFRSLLDLAEMGVTPNNRLASLVPYKGECKVVLMYQGMIDLAKRNGGVTSIYATLVHENDRIDIVQGTDRRIEHFPTYDANQPVVGCYAVVKYSSGDFDFEYMPAPEIESIARKSPAYGKKDGPWKNFWGEMAKKTVLRRLLKRQTMSGEIWEHFDKDGDKLDFGSPEPSVDRRKRIGNLPKDGDPFSDFADEKPDPNGDADN